MKAVYPTSDPNTTSHATDQTACGPQCTRKLPPVASISRKLNTPAKDICHAAATKAPAATLARRDRIDPQVQANAANTATADPMSWLLCPPSRSPGETRITNPPNPTAIPIQPL